MDVRYVDSGDEILALLEREDAAFDGASVPGDAAGVLIAARRVAAVDPELFPLWEHILEPLRLGNARHYVVDDHVYGVPALYGPNLLVYRADRVRRPPRSWGAVLRPGPRRAGRIAMLDTPMVIADAARFLGAHRPELGIEDPFALTTEQLDAAVALLEDQEPRVGVYWSLLPDAVDAFREGDVDMGMAWPIVLALLESYDVPFRAADPAEGMTGWADTWMIAADAPHPNCMLLWMRWTMTARVQADMALWYGGAPSNGEACPLIREDGRLPAVGPVRRRELPGLAGAVADAHGGLRRRAGAGVHRPRGVAPGLALGPAVNADG